MDILGIGVPELVFILLIALIVLGPKDMQKAGKTVGKWMRKVVMSDEWKGIKNASRRLKTLPNELMREANLDELGEELSDFNKYRNNKIKVTLPKDGDYGAWGGKPAPPPAPDNSIAPPVDEKPASAQKADAQPQSDTTDTASPDSE